MQEEYLELKPTLDQLLSLPLDEESDDFVIEEAWLKDKEVHELIYLFQSTPLPIRLGMWSVMDNDQWWPLLHGLEFDTSTYLLKALSEEQLNDLQEKADVSDIVDLAEILPQKLLNSLIDDLSDSDKADVEEALAYEEDQIGRYLHRDSMRLRQTYTVSVFWKLIKTRNTVYEPDIIYLVDDNKALCGQVAIKDLYKAPHTDVLSNYMTPMVSINAGALLADGARMLSVESDSNWIAVMENERLIGTIPAIRLLEEVKDHAVVNEIGAEEDDLFTPTSVAARRRAIWLTINLATAFLASWVIGFFELALQQIVALAVLMPVVASMGGVAGSQTLTVAVKGIVLNRLTNSNLSLLLKKEFSIAAINSIALGAVIALVTAFWFNSPQIGGIIFAAIVINGFAAAWAGTLIPFILKRLNIDPAISGAVILTTVTDVVGFLAFLGLATVFLLGA